MTLVTRQVTITAARSRTCCRDSLQTVNRWPKWLVVAAYNHKQAICPLILLHAHVEPLLTRPMGLYRHPPFHQVEAPYPSPAIGPSASVTHSCWGSDWNIIVSIHRIWQKVRNSVSRSASAFGNLTCHSVNNYHEMQQALQAIELSTGHFNRW